MPSEVSEISAQLAALVREKTGDPGARCSSLVALPGHAGQSYSFELDWRAPDGPSHEKLVLRLAPAGVRISGPADVARQGRIMASLADAAVPVPPVRWFQAFSAYRFGVITVFNLMLHRRGKRHDPVWEEAGKSAPRLFERGLELLDQGAAS